MSYEILYRARVIKTSRGLVPVIEMGSNNCYDYDNRRRARDFQNWYTLDSPQGGFLSLDAVLKDIERIRNEKKKGYPDYKDESWSYFTCLTLSGKPTTTTYNQFVNYFKLAYKKAKTVEEWEELGVSFQKRVKYKYRGDMSLEDYFVNKEDDLFDIDWQKVYITSYGEERKPFRSWRTVPQEVERYYVVRTPNGGYLSKNLKHGGYRYSFLKNVHPYKTKSEAKNAARGREGFVVEVVDEPHTFTKKEYLDNAAESW